ncbi:hypothetical protein GCM10023196_095080 [Actinoallomurus vinaceus]|uniref:Uncharacterized protein n=1 Tax=Actinoallomurus vinaceus TaxID=1080074 RepID=A0ABP8URL0_9ACTN
MLRHAKVPCVMVQPTGELTVLGLEIEQCAPVGSARGAAELLDDPYLLVSGRDDRPWPKKVVRLDKNEADSL